MKEFKTYLAKLIYYVNSTCLANIYDFTIYQFPTRCMMSIVIIWKPKFLLIQQAGGVT
jgi:hypothetical protein